MKEALHRIQSASTRRSSCSRTAPGAPGCSASAHDRGAADREGRRAAARMMPWIKRNRLVDTSKN